MTQVALPTGADVRSYLGAGDDQADLADARTAHMVTMVRSYVRGLGFAGDTVADDLAAVIVSAAARELNTAPGLLREEAGAYNVLYDGQAHSFTLRELATLNAYRRRAT